jgi:hypothetical protein
VRINEQNALSLLFLICIQFLELFLLLFYLFTITAASLQAIENKSYQPVLFETLENAVIINSACYIIGDGFEVFIGVSHRDPDSGALDHSPVVIAIPKGPISPPSLPLNGMEA